MKPKHPKFITEIDVEVVNRQPNAEERQEISAVIRASKKKAKHPVALTQEQQSNLGRMRS